MFKYVLLCFLLSAVSACTTTGLDGRYLLFSNQSEGGALEVFDSINSSSKALSDIYLG